MDMFLSEPLTIKKIAEHAGYSHQWLQSIFKQNTGQNLLSCLMSKRLDKAKSLLLETDLSITEIAFEVGFNSYTRFSIAFRNHEKTTPTAFRENARKHSDAPVALSSAAPLGSQKARERFRDDFCGTKIKECWCKTSGHWSQENGELRGQSEEDLVLSYMDPLPENFVVEFEFCHQTHSQLCLTLYGTNVTDYYLVARTDRDITGTGEFILPGYHVIRNHGVQIKPGIWQKARLEMIEDKVRYLIDGTEIFSAQDPFPPPYSSRCHFSISSWQTEFGLRNLAIYNCGFLPSVPAIRQADALYNNTLYGSALESYLRLLEAETEPESIMELHYKIGICFTQKQAFGQAREWLSKVIELPDPFWFHTAKHALLELDRHRQNMTGYIQNAKSLFSEPKSQDAVWTSLMRAQRDFSGNGFFEQALSCVQTLHELENPRSLRALLAVIEIPELLFQLKRNREAANVLEQMLNKEELPYALRLRALQISADVDTGAGNFAAAEKVLDQIRATTTGEHFHLYCDMNHGANLRGQGRFGEAIAAFSGATERYPGLDFAVCSDLFASHVYFMIGETGKAHQVLDEMQKRFPQNLHVGGYLRSLFYYPPFIFQRQYNKAAEFLLACETQSGSFSAANHAVRAGILFAIAGDKTRAESIWREVTRRYRSDRVCFYGNLARSLIEGTDVLEQMPYAAIYRAEMFYLGGLLFRAKGEEEKSQKYFRLAIKDDPALNWYTYLAKEEIRL